MEDRDRIYAGLLKWGLLRIREAAALGLVDYCQVEANHLHNLPTLLGEADERPHDYYYQSERTFYLERVDRSVPSIGFTLKRYEELWRELEVLRG